MNTIKTTSIVLTLIAATLSAQGPGLTPTPQEIGAMDLVLGGLWHQAAGAPGTPFDSYVLTQNPYLGNPATFGFFLFRQGVIPQSGVDKTFVGVAPGTHLSDVWLANLVGPALTVQGFSCDIYAWIPSACGAMSYDPTTGKVILRGHGLPNVPVTIRVNGAVVAAGMTDAAGNIALQALVLGGAGPIDATYGGAPWLGAITN